MRPVRTGVALVLLTAVETQTRAETAGTGAASDHGDHEAPQKGPRAWHDWPQDGGNAQRTGWTPEEPAWPWDFAWTWNGPDLQGGAGSHHYHQPRRHEPWEARVCAGGGRLFAPAGDHGLYALDLSDGLRLWRFRDAACHVSPAIDVKRGQVFIGTEQGEVIQLRASDGLILNRSRTRGAVAKSLLLSGRELWAVTRPGVLHAFDAETLAQRWVYDAGSPAATGPALSERAQLIVFATADLRVHGVEAGDGRPRWIVRPTPLEAAEDKNGSTVEFTGGWPVIAESAGLVFVRLGLSHIDTVLWSGGGPKGKWPTINADIRQRLVENPKLQNLFALRLTDGTAAFVPAIGPAGVEDMRDGRPRLRVGGLPVVRPVEGREVAYVQWRNGDTQDANWDARWDSHLGEMVLDADTVPGLVAGDVRFVRFVEHGGWLHITDESCPLSMAGDTLFYAHWDACSSARLVDRSPRRGKTRLDPILTEKRPPVVRHVRLDPASLNPSTHWHAGGLSLVDGRWLDGPGWWVYANTLDPPTPVRDAYSEGILPRYTLTAGGYVIIQGNGGDLFALRHAGSSGRSGDSEAPDRHR